MGQVSSNVAVLEITFHQIEPLGLQPEFIGSVLCVNHWIFVDLLWKLSQRGRFLFSNYLATFAGTNRHVSNTVPMLFGQNGERAMIHVSTLQVQCEIIDRRHNQVSMLLFSLMQVHRVQTHGE